MSPLREIIRPHRKNLYLVLVCLFILILLFLLTVVNNLKTRNRIELQLEDASRRADQSAMIVPLLAELQESDVAVSLDDITVLPPKISSATDKYDKVIGQLLTQCDLQQIALTPDIQSILSEENHIRVDLTARGSFANFRLLLLQLGRLPFLKGIDRFYLQRGPDAQGLEMFLQLRIQNTPPVDKTDESE